MANDNTIHDYCQVTDRSKQTIAYLNEMIEEGHVSDLILVIEARQERQLARIADDIARLQSIGRPVHKPFDLMIGCTAVTNNMIMVTENEKIVCCQPL